MKILFQPITILHKPFIHRTFRAVIGCQQPITGTHHLSPPNLDKVYCKHNQTARGNFCFPVRNKVFHALKRSVSSNETFSFKRMRLKFPAVGTKVSTEETGVSRQETSD